jgi:hypothetical protein
MVGAFTAVEGRPATWRWSVTGAAREEGQLHPAAQRHDEEGVSTMLVTVVPDSGRTS